MIERLLFLGPPGAGKGTQAEIFCTHTGLLHLSTGDLLREEVSAGTALGLEAASKMNKGELVTDSIVLSIVKNRLSGKAKGWLLDGFPRNVFQAEALELLLHELAQPLQVVVFIEIPDEFLIERLLARGRDDDNEDVIRHRLEVYREKTSPLVEHYKNKQLLKTVNGEGDIKSVSQRVIKAIS